MMKLLHVAAATAGVALLTACGLTKSPAEDITFAAPNGWQSTPGIMGRFQLWTGGEANAKQVLMLMKLPPDAKISKSFAPDLRELTAPTSVKNATMVAQRKMTICGSQPAMYMKMRGVSSTNGNQKVEEMIEAVVSRVPDGTLMAMHMYPVGSVPDPQAEAAIYELCPKN